MSESNEKRVGHPIMRILGAVVGAASLWTAATHILADDLGFMTWVLVVCGVLFMLYAIRGNPR